MRPYLLFLVLFTVCVQTSAQTLQGVVYDAANRKPVPDAFVYLDGTSLSTTTDAMGRFELKTWGIINTQLIVNHLSYAPFAVPNPFQEIPEIIYLQERDRQIAEVLVTADKFTRAQKMKAFKEHFLGSSRSGASCEILNEEDIVISYDLQTQILTAYSDKPVIVVNRFLGYRILFTLVDFRVLFAGGKIDNEYTRLRFFAVTSSYTDLEPDNRTRQRRRDNVYEQSTAYFYKNLIHQTLETNSYKIFHKQNQINPYSYFEVKDSLSIHHIQIKPGIETSNARRGVNITISSAEGAVTSILSRPEEPIFYTISVLFKRNIQSEIRFFTDQLFTDEYGNIDAIDKIIYTGHFGQLCAGDLLPLDFEPKK